MASVQESKNANLAVRNYLKRSFGRRVVATVAQEGHDPEYAKTFAEDLFFVDWSELDNEDERDLAFRLLGFDQAVWKDFTDQQRLEDSLAALLEYEKIDLDLALQIASYHQERTPHANPTYLIADIIIDYFQLDLNDKASLDLQRRYWQAHGMGYVPGQLYPFYSKDGPIFKASLAAVRAGMRSANKVARGAGIQLGASFIAHEIYSNLLWGGDHVIESVRNSIALSIFGSPADPLHAKRKHETAAVRGYWKTLGVDTDGGGTPLFY